MGLRLVATTVALASRPSSPRGEVCLATARVGAHGETWIGPVDEAGGWLADSLQPNEVVCTFDAVLSSARIDLDGRETAGSVIDLGVEARAHLNGGSTSRADSLDAAAAAFGIPCPTHGVLEHLVERRNDSGDVHADSTARTIALERAAACLLVANHLGSRWVVDDARWRGRVSTLLRQAASRGLPVTEDFERFRRFGVEARRVAVTDPKLATLTNVFPNTYPPMSGDGRTAHDISPFWAITGRAQVRAPALLLSHALVRGFVAPPAGRVLIVADVEAEEHGLAAALANDELAWSAYSNGDYYLQTACEAQLHVGGETDAHRRKQAKCAINLLLNEAALGTVVEASGLTPLEVLSLRRCMFESRTATLQWIREGQAAGRANGEMRTRRGWPLRVSRSVGDRTLRSFMLQGAGVDLLGDVLIEADRDGVELSGTLHDAFVFECEASVAPDVRESFTRAFGRACRGLLGESHTLRLSMQTINSGDRWLPAKSEQRFAELLALLERVGARGAR